MPKQTEQPFYALLAILFVGILWHIFSILNWIYIYIYSVFFYNSLEKRDPSLFQNEEDGECLKFETEIL